MLVSLGLEGLFFDHHHVSCFRRDELQDGEGGGGRKILVFFAGKENVLQV